MAPIAQAAIEKINNSIPGFAGLRIIAADKRLPATCTRFQLILEWFMQRDGLEPGRSTQPSTRSHNRSGLRCFIAIKGVEWMGTHLRLLPV
jgi:hypothetical protein